VWLESTPGAGTTACVALPLVDAPEPVDQTLSSQRPARSRRAGTILVVEDEPALLALLSRALTLAGYRVLSASDGRQALEVARGLDRRADLVVTDVVMPGLDGRELARRLEESWPDTRFLFMSGYSEAVVAAEGLMQPGSAFIAKPFSIEALLSRVDTLVPPPPGDTTGPEAPAP
jgi:DNA-binding response OmpR family regulator